MQTVLSADQAKSLEAHLLLWTSQHLESNQTLRTEYTLIQNTPVVLISKPTRSDPKMFLSMKPWEHPFLPENVRNALRKAHTSQNPEYAEKLGTFQDIFDWSQKHARGVTIIPGIGKISVKILAELFQSYGIKLEFRF
ncbi:MAG: hypothetical protein V4509_05510 [Patescibacteria group bacterium]